MNRNRYLPITLRIMTRLLQKKHRLNEIYYFRSFVENCREDIVNIGITDMDVEYMKDILIFLSYF